MNKSLKYSDVFNHDRPWFSVRYVVRHTKNDMYEEKTVLVKANSHEEALEKAETEAREYCQDLKDAEYLGYAETFHLFDEVVEDGTEIYSVMRSSNLSPEEYMKTYINTGNEVGIDRQDSASQSS